MLDKYWHSSGASQHLFFAYQKVRTPSRVWLKVLFDVNNAHFCHELCLFDGTKATNLHC